MKRAMAVLVLMAVVGCKKEKAGGAATPSPECKEKSSELRAYLTEVFDPSKKPAPPWPTGDAALDKDIDAARAKVRELMKPADPAAPAAPLTAGVKDSLSGNLETCPAVVAQLEKVAAAAPADRVATMIAVADAVERCDCEVSIPRIKAALYLGQRGPD
jgi:hypothetical protein